MSTYANGGEPAKFNCTMCGLCCAHVGDGVKLMRRLVLEGSNDPMHFAGAVFPYEFDETGRCSKLTEDNQCAVYENRPLICNIQQFHQRFFRHVPRQLFYDEQERYCHELQLNDQRNPQ